jgi:hypothetical protein
VKHLWRQHRSPESQLARRIALGATLLFLLIVTRGRPWDLFDRGAFSTDFYDGQARAFLHFRLDVPAGLAGPEGFLIDGRTYLYYGPFLALLRLPFVATGHWIDGRLSAPSLVLAFFLACTFTRHVAERAARVLGGGSPRRTAALVAAVACSPALSLAGWNSVYDETEMWAFALFLATTVALLALWERPSTRTLVLAVLAGTATVLTRSSVGIGALAAVGLVGLLLWRRDHRLALYACGGAVLGVLTNVMMNLAKFGTLLDLPADRQLLTLQNADRAAWFAGNDGSFFSPRFLPTTVVQYLRPDAVRFERLVPFARFGPLAHEYGSYPLEGNTPASSLPTSATLLCLLAVIGVWVVAKRRAWPFASIWVGAVIAAVPSFLIGFVANRYLTDMLPALVVPAAAAVAVVALPAGAAAKWAKAGFVVLVVWGTWVNTSFALWTQNLKAPGFTEFRYDLDDLVFGGAPPSVVPFEPGMVVPRDGVVAIDGQCQGLYIAEQGNWVPLELADGVRRLDGTYVAGGDAVVITTADAEIRIDSHDGTLFASYQPDEGEPVTGSPIDVPDGEHRVRITSDPVTGQLAVLVDDQVALFAFAAPDLTDADITDTLQREPRSDGGTPICAELEARQ